MTSLLEGAKRLVSRGSDIGARIEGLDSAIVASRGRLPDDLLDGIAWAAKEGLVDPKRVCIVGASYGGYAAMRGAQRDAAHYRCAIAYAGVSDLSAMKRYDQTFLGGHCEVLFRDCWVPDEAILGEAERGFDYAQVRLAPARLTHCMRWLGIARRSQEIAAGWASQRTRSLMWIMPITLSALPSASG